MLADLGLLIAGAVALYFGAEWLVRGAAGLARAMGVTPLAVGLTVVAYGTSAPELVVSTVSASQGKTDIALGNVLGSNIANIGLILGLTAIIAPPAVGATLWRREVPALLAATVAVPVMLLDGAVGRVDGGLLLLATVGFTVATLRWSKADLAAAAHASDGPAASETTDGSVAVSDEGVGAPGKPKLAAFAVVGLAALLAGGKLFVTGAVGIAMAVGMSERIVGLTIVAIGTSLPELAASLIAALRGHSEIAIGNVLGSNVFNVLLILGVASQVHPVATSIAAVRVDLAVMVLLTLLCAASMRTARRISRQEGALLVVVYAVFLLALAQGVH